MSTVSPDVVDPELQEGDESRLAHYVRKEDVARAYIEGTPVMALCGKVWVPSRDPGRFPKCPECVRQLARLNAAQQGAN